MSSHRSVSPPALTVVVLLAASTSLLARPRARPPRRSIDLDGVWQVEEGSMGAPPASFSRTVVVPGLLDMAEPAFSDVGKRSPRREAFWYRRTFRLDGPVPVRAMLKIHKAKYGTRILLNGALVGEHLPCFTPATLDVTEQLSGDGRENELLIRVGAHRESLPADMPTGWDFEKYLYIPGIYDSVELILTGSPTIQNVQTVPDLSTGSVRVIALLRGGHETAESALAARVKPAGGGESVGSAGATTPVVRLLANELRQVELTVPIERLRLWTPGDPFLYDLELDTAGDAVTVTFGMRSFRFDRETGRAILNGRPIFLRGTNVCIYRFFEDEARGDRPWRKDWVRRLHRKFRSMHWSAIRYCIGFPPDLWYEIADEEGFLIQDEFPIWLLAGAPESPVAEKIIPQYRSWMHERWNHPCVVIWDAQNESVTEETGKALRAVRDLDRSHRPWENGWAAPQSPADCVEAHPYLFSRAWSGKEPFRLADMAGLSGRPPLRAGQKALDVPVIINEYAWLWLTRDGQPTCLTDRVYASLLGPDSSVQQRRRVYARYLAALTEFWRAHRECAGVLHFCGLGYSRPGDRPRPEGGATSDHFLDLETLELEPNFERLVRDAFDPVGVMLDFWAEEIEAGKPLEVRVFVINDRNEPWRGRVRVTSSRGAASLLQGEREVEVAGLGRKIMTLTVKPPEAPGALRVVAERVDGRGTRVRSERDTRVVVGTPK